MPTCCAMGCHNRIEKGYRVYKLPQGEKNNIRRKQWIQNIGRKDSLSMHACVCQDHFTDDQFEPRKIGRKRSLKYNAVPTLFPHKGDISKLDRKVPRRDIMTSIALEYNDISEELMDDSINIESKIRGDINLRDTTRVSNSSEVAVLKNELNSSHKQLQVLKVVISQLQMIIGKLVNESYISEINDE